jgi:hypothetical protein
LVNGEPISEDLVLFSRPKHLMLNQPHITTNVQQVADGEYDISLTTDCAALYVWLELPGAQFSDNFVHLRPNISKTIRVSAQDLTDLKVQSLADTYE